MTKLYFLFLTILFVFLVACNYSSNTNASNLKVNSLEYSAYRWRINEHTSDWELFLAYYIKVNKNGSYLAMRHNTTPEPSIYFKGKIDSLGLQLLDSLAVVQLDTLYINFEPRIYDGNTFHLTFDANEKNQIDFYQIDAPPYLQRVSMALDKIIFASNDRADPFDLSFKEQELRRQSIQRLGRLPEVENPKFK